MILCHCNTSFCKEQVGWEYYFLSLFFFITCIVKDNIQHFIFKYKYCTEEQHKVAVKTRVFSLDRCDFELAVLLTAAARVKAIREEQNTIRM